MAAGGSAGVVTVWDLEERRIHTIIKDAHQARLLGLHFFAGQPVLLSSGADNSLKQWLFDAADGSARLLGHRSGHSAPPTCLRSYSNGRCLLSAGAGSTCLVGRPGVWHCLCCCCAGAIWDPAAVPEGLHRLVQARTGRCGCSHWCRTSRAGS